MDRKEATHTKLMSKGKAVPADFTPLVTADYRMVLVLISVSRPSSQHCQRHFRGHVATMTSQSTVNFGQNWLYTVVT